MITTKNLSKHLCRQFRSTLINISKTKLIEFLLISRNILCKAKEVGFKSIAVCVVSTVQRNFPPDIGAHIALSNEIIK